MGTTAFAALRRTTPLLAPAGRNASQQETVEMMPTAHAPWAQIQDLSRGRHHALPLCGDGALERGCSTVIIPPLWRLAGFRSRHRSLALLPLPLPPQHRPVVASVRGASKEEWRDVNGQWESFLSQA